MGEAFAPTTDAFLEAEHHAEEVLRTALERLSPDAAVTVEAVAVEGHPATVLVEQARDAELLVVGSRGRGAAKSLLLGSVSQSLAHQTPCPLVIVPDSAARPESARAQPLVPDRDRVPVPLFRWIRE